MLVMSAATLRSCLSQSRTQIIFQSNTRCSVCKNPDFHLKIYNTIVVHIDLPLYRTREAFHFILAQETQRAIDSATYYLWALARCL
jgi:hypothetical protein